MMLLGNKVNLNFMNMKIFLGSVENVVSREMSTTFLIIMSLLEIFFLF